MHRFMKIILVSLLGVPTVLFGFSTVDHPSSNKTPVTELIQRIIHQRQGGGGISVHRDDNRPVFRLQFHASRYSLVLFYMSRCPHCQRFDPILKNYAIKNHLSVLAYTLDGQSLPSYPNSEVPTPEERQLYFPLNRVVVPTLFLVDNEKRKIFPVLKGEATSSQLEWQIKQVIAKENSLEKAREGGSSVEATPSLSGMEFSYD